MIPTEYLRQVPIKHWLPVPWDCVPQGVVGLRNEFGSTRLEEVITGYKTQRAFAKSTSWEADDEYHTQRNLLGQGEEVEGFQWLDIPVKE